MFKMHYPIYSCNGHILKFIFNARVILLINQCYEAHAYLNHCAVTPTNKLLHNLG